MAGDVVNIKVCTPLNLRIGLTGNYHAICHYSYNLPLCTSMQPPRVNKQLCGMILFWNFIQHFHKTTFPLICRQTYNLTIKIYSVLFTNSSDLIFSE